MTVRLFIVLFHKFNIFSTDLFRMDITLIISISACEEERVAAFAFEFLFSICACVLVIKSTFQQVRFLTNSCHSAAVEYRHLIRDTMKVGNYCFKLSARTLYVHKSSVTLPRRKNSAKTALLYLEMNIGAKQLWFFITFCEVMKFEKEFFPKFQFLPKPFSY